MISKFAIDEIESLQESGLNPTPRDIIRLNALAMKVHAARGQSVRNTTFLLPRVSVLEGGRSFREPSIGHEIWLDGIRRYIDPHDLGSVLAVNCFALSRSAADLPRLDDIESVGKAIKAFCEEYKDYTVRQLEAAISYVKNGADWTDGERPAAKKRDNAAAPVEDDPKSDLVSDDEWSVAVGVLHEGITVLSGLTLAEMKEMSRRDIEDAIRKACWIRGKSIGSDEETVALANFYATLEEIKNRLTKEKENGTAS